MAFNIDGSINTRKTLAQIKLGLEILSTQPLDRNLLDSLLTEIVQLGISPHALYFACNFLEENILRRTGLTESKIPLSHIGDRSLEWDFFQRRKEKAPDNPMAFISKHLEVGNLILEDISQITRSLSSLDSTNIYRMFMRYKSIESSRRKMRSKALKSWEIGDYLGFFICPSNFSKTEELVNYIDIEYANNIMYKQNGFADRLVFKHSAPGIPGRRIFYIIQFDDVTCFEIQIASLRQFIFLYLDHPRYQGTFHTPNELRSLELFGDSAYLLDLLEFIDEPKRSELLKYFCEKNNSHFMRNQSLKIFWG